MAAAPLTLSQTRPDFDSLVIQLQMYLNSRASWKDMLTSSTGQTLIEMMAAVGAFNQFAIENGARESFLTSAVRDSSIYAITRMLGVRIGRKSSASTPATLTRTNTALPQVVAAYTQFTVNGVMFFNRNDIVFSSGETQPNPLARDAAGNLLTDANGLHYTDPNFLPVLYEGQVKTQTFPAVSTSFNEITLNEPGFVVSDTDVVVSVITAGTGARAIWSPIVLGIWTAGPLDTVYYDSTLGTGDTVLSFGDGNHGALAGLGNTIEVKYVVTQGSLGNNGGPNLVVACAEYPQITGVNTQVISGGSDEKPSSYYKVMAPAIYRARSRAVTTVDYKAIIAGYSGVAGVTVQAQKDIAPNDLRWMNVVRVCILPSDHNQVAFTAQQWAAFLLWFKDYHHAAIDIQIYDPINEPIDIEVVISLSSNAVAETVVAQVQARIQALFVRDITTLGRRVALSDIIDSCAVPTVDYTTVLKLQKTGTTSLPSDCVPLDNLSFLSLNSLVVGAQYSERTLYNEAARRII